MLYENQQAIEILNKAADKIDAFLNNNAPRMGKGKRKTEVKSNITDNQSAKMTTSKGTIQVTVFTCQFNPPFRKLADTISANETVCIYPPLFVLTV